MYIKASLTIFSAIMAPGLTTRSSPAQVIYVTALKRRSKINFNAECRQSFLGP